MYTHRLRTLLLSAAFVGTMAPMASASLIVGTYSGYDNTLPFSSMAGSGSGVYQQIYSAGAFGGPISIGSLGFTVGSSGGADEADYIIKLATTSSRVGDAFPLVAGANAQVFGTFHVAGGPSRFTAGDVLTFTGTPFLYDPSEGNLLMEITFGAGTVCPGGCARYAGFQANAGDQTSRALLWFGNTSDDPFGVVTTFGEAATASPVPEPGTMVLCGSGLVFAARLVRRKR